MSCDLKSCVCLIDPQREPNGTDFRKVTRCVSEGVRLFLRFHTPLLTLQVPKVSAIEREPAECPSTPETAACALAHAAGYLRPCDWGDSPRASTNSLTR